MTALTEALQIAKRFQAAGDLAQAARVYHDLAGQFPDCVEVLGPLGLVCLKLGRPAEAIMALEPLLRLDPDRAESHAHLGVALGQLGRESEGEVHFRAAIRLQPGSADHHGNLGNALRSLGRLDEAVAALRQALRLNPEHPEALRNLGLVLIDQGQATEGMNQLREALRLRPESVVMWQGQGDAQLKLKLLQEAEASYRRGVQIDPAHAHCLTGLGTALLGQRQWAEAAEIFQKVLRLEEPVADASGSDDNMAMLRAEVHNFLGVALAEQDLLPEAVRHYREAIRCRPHFAAALSNLGLALSKQDLLEEALSSLNEAVRLSEDFAEAHSNLGLVLLKLDRETEALTKLRQAIRARPDFAQGHSNLGNVLMDLGRPDEAWTCFEEALHLEPDNGECHKQVASVLLLNGAWERGWQEYEWRWTGKVLKPRNFAQPQWQGEPLAGRSILLHVEQGMGDTIQYIRFAPLVKEGRGVRGEGPEQGRGVRGEGRDHPSSLAPLPPRVLVECVPDLMPLLHGCPGIDQWIVTGKPRPPFDVHLPLMSLPRVLGTTLETLPAQVPYIHPQPERVARWRDELASIPGFKIGIVWQGNRSYGKDKTRSIPLRCLAPVAEVPGVQLLSLQRGHGADQLAAVRSWPIIDLGARLDLDGFAFVDTAAVMSSLDLIISSDTALAHLAGALGVPIWLALSYAAEWRWLRDRQDSPWYPTMRLFRQTRLGDWDGVFERMARELEAI